MCVGCQYACLCVSGPLEEELDDGGEQLQLDLAVLVVEVLQEGGEQFVHGVDAVAVLAQDPDHGSPAWERDREEEWDGELTCRAVAHVPAHTHLASGSSRESRFSQRVEMIRSYWFGYLRKMS